MRTYGTVSLDPKSNAWKIECEPHVSLRLKRVFRKLGNSSHGKFRLSATAENSRDLVWFMDRYPMEVKDRERLDQLAQEYRDREALVDRLMRTQTSSLPFELATPAREYQKVAAEMMLGTRGLLLADDVGLGKTASAICALADPRMRPALVVTLTHLPVQWVRELKKFAPHLTTHVIKSGKPYDLTKRRRGQPNLFGDFPDVLIINYHKLSGWAETLAPLVRSVIYDEVQELRRDGTQRYSAAEHITALAEFRIGLSATPIYNYGGEIFNVLEAVAPGKLGTREEFREEWCGFSFDDKKLIVRDPKALGTYLLESGLMLRRTRRDVNRELPDLTRVPHHVEADAQALDKVSNACAELARIILAQSEGYRGQKMHASEELSIRLRQATGIAKAPYVAEFVRLLVESGEQVVLYGWHREVYSIWQDRLKDLNPVLYTGTESPIQKDAAREAFVRGESKVLLISLRAGAGLDGLQHSCRTVVFGELDWSPGVHEQCIGRVHRDGQTEPVVAYFLVADSGSDPIVADVLGLKRDQIEGVVNPGADLVENLQVDGGHVRRLAEAYLQQKSPALEVA